MTGRDAGAIQELRAVVPGASPWTAVVGPVVAAVGVNLTIGGRLPIGVRLAFTLIVVAVAIPATLLLRRGLREMALRDEGGEIIFRDMRGRVHRFQRAEVGALRSLTVRSTATIPRLYVLDHDGGPLLRLDPRQWRMRELRDFFGADGVAYIDESTKRVSGATLRRSDRRYVGFVEAHSVALVALGTVMVIFAGSAVLVALGGH